MDTGLAIILEAKTKPEILSLANNLSIPLRKHLYKIACIYDTENEIKWLAEVNEWMLDINDNVCKTKLSEQQLYSKLYNDVRIPVVKKSVWVKYMLNNPKHTICVYDNFRKALKFVNPLLLEFSRIPLKSFEGIEFLTSYKKMIKARGSSHSLYNLESIDKA